MTATGKKEVCRRARFVVGSVGLLVASGLILFAPPLYRLLVPRSFTRAALIGFLWAMIGAQIVAWVLVPAGIAVLATVSVRGRRRGVRTSWATRWLLLLLSVGSGLIGAEAVGAVWLASVHRFPALPTSFDRDDDLANPNRSLLIAVIGESSARGEPYDGWLSVPAIVAWQLERVLPGRKVVVQMLTKNGATLEQIHQRIAELRRRPDAVFIYSGHNEFQSRFPWERYVPYYVDDNPSHIWDQLEEMGRWTSFGRIMVDVIEKQRLDRPPPPRITRELVDVPAFTVREGREVLVDYGARLDAIGAYSRKIGAVPILVVPACNDGDFEPNRSILPPGTTRSERDAFRRRFQAARDAEAAEPVQAIRLYRTLTEQQPGFAETHFRLARLLRRAGDAVGARRHFTLARDLDGMPQRCPTPLVEACRAAGKRNDAVLVDGPSVLGHMVTDAILDDRLFHDAHHPTLIAYIALAQETLRQLYERRAFDWPNEAAMPVIDPDDCAAHFGVGPLQWTIVCYRTSLWYSSEAYIRFDPSLRLEKGRRLAAAGRRIEQGVPPEALDVSGYGCHPRLDDPAPETDVRPRAIPLPFRADHGHQAILPEAEAGDRPPAIRRVGDVRCRQGHERQGEEKILAASDQRQDGHRAMNQG
jgi:hypothetical protein